MTDVTLKSPCVIVTGAAGWLGSRVVAALSGQSSDPAAPGVAVPSVRALVMPGENTAKLTALGAQVFEGDVRDRAALDQLMAHTQGATVIHLAGIIHPPLFTSLFDKVNLDGTLNVLDAARAAGAHRVVIMSSNSPIGTNPHPGHLFDEASPYKPYMGYGRSKMRMEQAVKARVGAPGEPESVIVRAPWFYGPGQPPRQTLFFKLIREGKFPLVGDGRQRRSMAYVDTLASGLIRAAAVPQAAGQTYWIADERPYAFAEIIETVRTVLRDDFAMDVADKTARLPGVVSDVARIVDGSLQAVGLYQQKIHVLSELNTTIACDVSKATTELGFRPEIELREGMRRSVAWCLDEGLSI